MKASFDKERTFCPLCSSEKIEKHYHIQTQPAFDTSICADCGFIFMNPPISDDSLIGLYSLDYYTGKSSYSYMDERENESFSAHVWNARLKKIRRFVSSGKFLDIGCSFGLFLKRASAYFETYGVEFSEDSAIWAKNNTSARIYNESAENFTCSESFNVITLIELIEHIKEPARFLENIYSLTAEGGLAVIQTADMSAWQAVNAGEKYHYYLPGHLSYFSEENLTAALLKHGFKKIKVFRPVDFGLLPKLLKSRGSFKSFADYKRWLEISLYHLRGYFRKNGRAVTSSMVIYAFK